jgi:hypothetical protein
VSAAHTGALFESVLICATCVVVKLDLKRKALTLNQEPQPLDRHTSYLSCELMTRLSAVYCGADKRVDFSVCTVSGMDVGSAITCTSHADSGRVLAFGGHDRS